MKRHVNAAIVAAALTVGMSSGAMTAQAQAGDHVLLPQYTDWNSCTQANPGQNHWTSFGDGPEACYGPATVTPSTPEEPAGPTKEPRPGLWQKPANTTEDGKHCLPGYKRDMGIFDINGQAGECVKAETPEPEKPSEPEKPKPSEPEKPKPSEPEKPKPSDSDKPSKPSKPSDKPSKPSKPSDDKKKDDKKSSDKKKDDKKKDDTKVVAKPSTSTQPAAKMSESKKPTSTSQKPAAQAQKSNGALAMTGVSVGGLLLAAVAMTGAGVFLIRRRQNS